jgi:isopentenyl-diphosphate Delta-isomerase
MALCTIVDRDDNILGYKERDQIEPGDIYRISAVWVVNTRGEVLLAQRTFTKKNDPGKWSTGVAGTVENKESYDDNAVKEAREELGINNIEMVRGPKLLVLDNGYGRGYFCQTFVAVLDWPIERFRLQAEEVVAVRWVSLNELKDEMVRSPEHFTSNFPKSSVAMIDFVQKHRLNSAAS